MVGASQKKGAATARSKAIFAIDEESSAGGTSYCWVERRKDGYYLFGNELGKMCGPCDTVHGALAGSGFQFGMDYMFIETTLSMVELRRILRDRTTFILSNVGHLAINGVKVDPREFTSSGGLT
jgi:hypothetical protein